MGQLRHFRHLRTHLLAAASAGVLASCITPAPRLTTAPTTTASDESFVDVGDAWLRVRDTGPKDSRKQPVVLVHGFGARLDNWRAVQDALDDDRRVIAFDQKGFGQSERTAGAYGPDRHADDVLKIMDALGVDHAVLAGHSYGAGVILRVAINAPDRVDGVVVVDGFVLERQVPTSFRWAKAPVMGEAIFSVLFSELPGEKYIMAFHDGQRFTSTKVLDEVHAMQDREGSTFAQLNTVRAMHYADVEPKYLAAVVDKPRGVVWGDDDRVTPLRHGRAVAAALDAPLVIAADAGHVPLIERPAIVTAELQRVCALADAAPKRQPLLIRKKAPLADVEDATGDASRAAEHDDKSKRTNDANDANDEDMP